MALSGHILWSFVILSGHMPCASSECSEVAGASIHRAAERNCPKRLGCAYNVSLQATETVLFGPFWPPYTGKIYARSVAHTSFRTVSLGNLVNSGVCLLLARLVAKELYEDLYEPLASRPLRS